MDELLREAACLGNLDGVQKLLERGTSINSQNKMNGWTALHWACKRGHVTVVEYLLRSGADVKIVSKECESVVDVTSNEQVLELLAKHGFEMMTAEMRLTSSTDDSVQDFVPNYLQNPPFPHYDIQKSLDRLPTVMDPLRRTHLSPNSNSTSPAPYTNHARKRNTASSEESMDKLEQDLSKLNLQKQQKATSITSSSSSFPSSPSSTSHHPSSPLLVKVRVSGSRESDFVEVEVTTPTYSTLVSACCEELELVTSDVAKIRKLPNILVRKDRDVQRMTDSQELEVVLKERESERL